MLEGNADTGFLPTPVAVHGSYAYVGDNGGCLHVAGISVPGSPCLVSSSVGTGVDFDAAHDVVIDGGYAFCAVDGIKDRWILAVFPLHCEGGVTCGPCVTSDAGSGGGPDVQVRSLYPIASPNPSRGSAEFYPGLPSGGRARVELLDVSGRRLRSRELGEDGPARVSWDGRDGRGRPVASGVYWVRVRSGNRTQYERLTVVR